MSSKHRCRAINLIARTRARRVLMLPIDIVIIIYVYISMMLLDTMQSHHPQLTCWTESRRVTRVELPYKPRSICPVFESIHTLGSLGEFSRDETGLSRD